MVKTTFASVTQWKPLNYVNIKFLAKEKFHLETEFLSLSQKSMQTQSPLAVASISRLPWLLLILVTSDASVPGPGH